VPVPDKRELKRFCELDGWEETSATSPDHVRYRKRLDDGNILRTRISHGRGPACDDPNLWHRIWKVQLGLDSEEEFWRVLRTGTPAQRGAPIVADVPTPRMPTWLFEFLVNVVGMAEDEVLGLSEDEAMHRYMQHIGPPRPA
jgi:hypothetical protein